MSSNASGGVPVEYITISGPSPILPENPITFNDGLILKTDEELRQMDKESLMKYSSSISTSISLEAATLIMNQRAQTRYLQLKMESQRIIDDLDNEIAINKALIDSFTEYSELSTYDSISTAYVSTLAQYEFDLAEEQRYMTYYTSSLSSYMDIYSNLEAENSVFNKAATQYSSLYMIYYGYQEQYDDISSQLNAVTIQLNRAKSFEEASYVALEESTIRWTDVSERLVVLRNKRQSIEENIIVCKREESRTYLNYMSTLDELDKIKSVYAAAVANEEYALAISTTTGVSTDYSDAVEQFDSAELLYNNSIPQGGGGVSGTVQGNSVLWAARTMAKQRLEKTTERKISSENATASLLNLADLANTQAYERMLLGYDNSILAYATTELKFRNYKLSSLQRVAEYSSIYEQSLIDITKYSDDIVRFSSFYESSILGASTLLILSAIDLSTIEGDTADYYAVSRSISTLNEQYSTCLNEYDSAVEISTMFQQEYLKAAKDLEQNTEYYDSTNRVVLGLTYDLYGTTGSNGLINVYNNTVFIYSSIFNKEIINAKAYDAQMKECVTLQDISMYQFRETYCRSTRFMYQRDYETKVYAEVQYAQSLTDSQQANSPPGVTVSPVAANLTTRVITDSYSKLVSIYTFLDLFEDIYMTYDTQVFNINTLSTSIGNESSAWSTLDFYTKAQYANRPWAIRTYGSNFMSNISDYVTTSCDTFTMAQVSTSALLGTYAETQSIIDTKKMAIMSNLRQFYSATEIEDQNTTISSFIMTSIAEAAALVE